MNIKIKNGIGAWLVPCAMGALTVVMVLPAQAASFDCAKARTDVEKLICRTQELSGLDDEVARRFQNMSEVAVSNRAALRLEQLRWLRHRDLCQSSSCLTTMYKMRLDELSETAVSGKGKVNVRNLWKGSEKPNFLRESEKLSFLRRLISAELEMDIKGFNPDPKFCSQLLKDVLSGTNVKIIEPKFVTRDPDDTRLQKFERCEDEPARAMADPQAQFGSIYNHIGGPPYRYYQLELDGISSNGQEDIVATDYVPDGDDGHFTGKNGFFWLDAKECVSRDGAGVSLGYGLKILPPNSYRLSMLIERRGKYYGMFFLPYLTPLNTQYEAPRYLLELRRIGGVPGSESACGATLNPRAGNAGSGERGVRSCILPELT